ncbi:hypothetical protein [Fuerstiella marisgermanici]|uniref:Uncharacterized protein n=1 Tax=Fuerstiella marisgermanici TaxID=1891926 RepID=A0A1P8WMD1_9PLAN|nr:hypothetical protein [Fuerstiella marisgermanici]APZ95204.1 hypothetical protein Fuma_04860 [Fuerstiella marisgermanici]
MARRSYNTKGIRFWIFAAWCAMMVVYVSFFFVVGAVPSLGVNRQEASDVAVRTIFIHLPVLAAFGSFWFSIDQDTSASQFKPSMPKQEAYAIWMLTGLVHVIVVLYLVLFLVAFPPDFPDTYEDSFRGIANFGVDLLVILSGLAYLPVEFLTRRKVVLTDG